jgi:hypothetical protein
MSRVPPVWDTVIDSEREHINTRRRMLSRVPPVWDTVIDLGRWTGEEGGGGGGGGAEGGRRKRRRRFNETTEGPWVRTEGGGLEGRGEGLHGVGDAGVDVEETEEEAKEAEEEEAAARRREGVGMRVDAGSNGHGVFINPCVFRTGGNEGGGWYVLFREHQLKAEGAQGYRKRLHPSVQWLARLDFHPAKRETETETETETKPAPSISIREGSAERLSLSTRHKFSNVFSILVN